MRTGWRGLPGIGIAKMGNNNHLLQAQRVAQSVQQVHFSRLNDAVRGSHAGGRGGDEMGCFHPGNRTQPIIQKAPPVLAAEWLAKASDAAPEFGGVALNRFRTSEREQHFILLQEFEQTAMFGGCRATISHRHCRGSRDHRVTRARPDTGYGYEFVTPMIGMTGRD